jgi:hypothetical protein
VHPKGTLIWEAGQVPDQDIPDDGTEVMEQGLLKAKRRLAPQLELTRFRGHLNVRFGGVHDGRQECPVHAGV